MKKSYSSFLIMLLLLTGKLFSVTVTATGSGNWNSTAVNAPWPLGIVPSATDDVIIPATSTVYVTTSQSCKSILLNGTLNFNTNSRILAVSDDLTLAGSAVVAGNGATRQMTVGGNFTVSLAATAQLGAIDLQVAGTSQFSGGLSIITGTAGTKVFAGAATFSNGSSVTYSVSETLDFSGNVTTNGIVTASGSTAGLMNIAGNLSVSTGAVFNISDLSLAVTGTTTVSGTIRFNNNNGTKTFGAITIAAGGTWDCSAVDEQFINNGNLVNNGTFLGSLSNTSGTEYAFSQPGLSISGTLTIANLRVASSSSSVTNNGILTVTNLLNGNGTFIQGTGSTLYIQIPGGTGNFSAGFDATTNTPNLTDYNLAAAQDVRNVSYSDLSVSASGTKLMAGSSIVVYGNLTIQGTAQLDADALSNRTLTVKGNWTVTSTSADPFLEQQGSVVLSGSSGTQLIRTPLAQETFYHLTISNTSGTTPGLKTTKHLNVTYKFDMTAGTLDLNGKNLVVTNSSASSTSDNLNGGLIMTSTSGSTIDFSDGSGDNLDVLFNGTNVGTAAFPIPLTITTGRCCIDHLELYGIGSFTKQKNTDDVCNGGGNIYHNAVTFTTEVTASRWRMGDSGASPDIYYGNATFNANSKGGSNNNFIIGANSTGNEYYGTTTFFSSTIGGFYVGRSNGTGNNSHTFHGPVVITVNDSGNVVLGNAASANLSVINIESSIQLNSNSASIGDIYIGNNSYTTVNMYSAGQIIDGNITGATNIYFNNITQTNTLTNTTTSSAVSNSTIYVGTGSGTNGPCVFGGNVQFTSPNISLRGSTFNGSNTFTANGTAGFSSYGGNTFNGISTFINNGTGYWRLANSQPDDFNANTLFKQLGTGTLDPSYATMSTFSAGISTLLTTTAITFGAGGGGVIIDGSSSQLFLGQTTYPPVVKKLTMATSGGGSLTLNVPLTIAANGALTNTTGKIYTTAAYLLKMADETTSSTIGNASSYVDGPMMYTMSLNGSATLNLPLGKGSDWRPAVLNLTHNASTAYSYTAELFNASAYALGYTIPATLDTVSFVHYWQIDRTLTSSGAASQSNLTAASVQLYYDVNDGVYNASNLRVAKTITTGTAWNNMGGTGTANYTGSITSTVNFTSFCKFTLSAAVAAIWNPLPVELLSFHAKACGADVCLDWSTATETNNDFFTIEKTKDGQKYETAGITDGAGNSAHVRNYVMTDLQPYAGESYYRLKQTNFDGSSTYSELVPVDFSASGLSIDIYPNPSDGQELNLVTGPAAQDITITVYDMSGQRIYNGIIPAGKSGMYTPELAGRLAPGIYLLRAVSGGNQLSRRLVIK